MRIVGLFLSCDLRAILDAGDAMTNENASPNGRPVNIGNAPVSIVDVIIPALNEEASLPLVLGDLPKVRRVFVVDNGSSDNTAGVATKLGAVVVDQPQRGYGAACLQGLAAIRERIQAGDRPPGIVVFLDADYSDHPEMLTGLVEPIQSGEFDMVLGSRLLGKRELGAMPFQSVFGNKFACLMMRFLFGFRYTDLGPFRAIEYSRLCELQMCDENFGWTIEMQIKAVRANLRIHEVPVPYRKRIGKSKISGTIMGSVKAGSKILYTIARYGRLKNRSRLTLRATVISKKESKQAVA